MDLLLTDKIAIVTGSSRGLGLATARTLVSEGCRVCICARGSEQLAAAAVEVEASARRPNMIMMVQADVSTADGATDAPPDGAALRGLELVLPLGRSDEDKPARPATHTSAGYAARTNPAARRGTAIPRAPRC